MKLIHLSDLHFGTEEPEMVDALITAVRGENPDLVIVSGDFAQVGSAQEFSDAQKFLNELGTPVFCVPGNHDVPALDLWERFTDPYRKYRTYIHEDLCPVLKTNNAVIAGLNTARRFLPHWNWANGAISKKQLRHLRDVYQGSGSAYRICVFHHPVHKAQDAPLDTVVFGGTAALKTIYDLNLDLVLTGHVHHASVTTMGEKNHKTVFLSASTALSTRKRGYENGYNVIALTPEEIIIHTKVHSGGAFALNETYHQARN